LYRFIYYIAGTTSLHFAYITIRIMCQALPTMLIMHMNDVTLTA